MDRGRLRRIHHQPRRRGHRSARHRGPELADRAVLDRGRRAGRHAGDPPGRSDSGTHLGCVDADPVLRRADQRSRQSYAAAPLPERTYIYEYDSAAGTLGFSAQGSDFTVDLPVNPMLGTVGVAPARREVRSSLVPEAFGGNMKTPEMAVGATCYLREYSRNQYPTAWGQITNVLASGCLPQPGAGHELHRRPFAAEEAHRVIDQRLERSGNLARVRLSYRQVCLGWRRFRLRST